MNTSTYIALIGSKYIELSDKLKNPMKDLINIKNNYSITITITVWPNIKDLNPLKTHPERITKVNKKE